LDQMISIPKPIHLYFAVKAILRSF